ncbi:hypothetical protein JCM10449v2_001757 [Rhodotorula kratochvilovae]
MDGLTIAATRPRRARKARVAMGNSDEEYGGGGGGGGGDGAGRRLRIRVGQGGGGPGSNPVDSVGWDRELDSDPDEPLAVEEHFILRVPPELAPRLKEQVDRRDLPPDTWFKFKDSRRAVFHLGKKLYGAKLVDLPALLESQRLTGVGGQTVKVADVSQMLLVEEEIQDEAQATRDKVFNIEDFVYPHGITPPLKHVRKRRFRRRINRRTIEQVEAAVEKLLEADARAEKVQVETLDYDVPSDDEDYDPTNGQQKGSESAAPTPRADGAPSSPAPFLGDDESQRGGDDYDDESDGAGSGSGYDSDLAKEIEKDLGFGTKDAAGTDDSDDDGDGLFGGSSDDDDDDDEQPVQAGGDAETLELRNQIKEAAEAMASLDKAIEKKEAEIAKATNVLFKKRFEAQLRGMVTDRKTKSLQHDEAARELDRKRQDAAAAATAEATNPPSMAAVVQPVVGGTPAEDAMDQS